MLIYTHKFDVPLFLVKTNLMNKCQCISIIYSQIYYIKLYVYMYVYIYVCSMFPSFWQTKICKKKQHQTCMMVLFTFGDTLKGLKMDVYIHLYIYIYIHIYTNVLYNYIYTHVCVYIYIYICFMFHGLWHLYRHLYTHIHLSIVHL